MGKYLIVKFAAICDVVMALSMITMIRKTDYNVHITWICEKTVEQIIREFDVDEIIDVLNIK